MRVIHWLCICLLSTMVLTVRARVWSADDIPMVHLEDRTKYVSDPESLLTKAMRDSADQNLRMLHTECGVQSVFVVVGKVKDADCFRMAQDIGNKYGVGTAKERRGLVIVIAVDDRRYFIAPGKGLEGDLPDIVCDDIARVCIVKNMKNNDLDLAVTQTAKAIYNQIKRGKTGLRQIDQTADLEEEDWFGVLLIILIFFGAPIYMLVRYILEKFGLVKKRPVKPGKRRRDDDDWFPPFIFGGGGGFGGGVSGGSFGGGSFGGGSFGGGGAGGGW